MLLQLPQTENWPEFIHRLWGTAKFEQKLLVISHIDGESFAIDDGPISTGADTVKIVDEQGSEISIAYAAIAGVLLVEP